jgi:hypothetical protein
VYKVDLDAGVLVPAKSLGGRAVFVGFFHTVSVSVDAFDIAADTLYFGYECGGDASYNLGSAEATYYRDVIVEACDCDETDEPCNHNMDYEWQGPLNRELPMRLYSRYRQGTCLSDDARSFVWCSV